MVATTIMPIHFYVSSLFPVYHLVHRNTAHLTILFVIITHRLTTLEMLLVSQLNTPQTLFGNVQPLCHALIVLYDCISRTTKPSVVTLNQM
jgi:hypothetical protein